MPFVTALVSTYNAAQFLEGCIEDLTRQTLYAGGELEIVVINSGSKDNTAHILRHYLKNGINLKIITSLREPMYTALNRGIRLATGTYLTIANTDDRHAPDALEILSSELAMNQHVGLVYADCYVTSTPNAQWGSPYTICYDAPYTTGRLNWPDFDPLQLTQHYYCGPQPMWRKLLHAKYGLFDESYLLSGDYEFVLRLAAQGVVFQRVPEVLGLFYNGGMNIAHQQHAGMESRRAIQRWKPYIIRKPQPA